MRFNVNHNLALYEDFYIKVYVLYLFILPRKKGRFVPGTPS